MEQTLGVTPSKLNVSAARDHFVGAPVNYYYKRGAEESIHSNINAENSQPVLAGLANTDSCGISKYFMSSSVYALFPWTTYRPGTCTVGLSTTQHNTLDTPQQ